MPNYRCKGKPRVLLTLATVFDIVELRYCTKELGDLSWETITLKRKKRTCAAADALIAHIPAVLGLNGSPPEIAIWAAYRSHTLAAWPQIVDDASGTGWRMQGVIKSAQKSLTMVIIAPSSSTSPYFFPPPLPHPIPSPIVPKYSHHRLESWKARSGREVRVLRHKVQKCYAAKSSNVVKRGSGYWYSKAGCWMWNPVHPWCSYNRNRKSFIHTQFLIVLRSKFGLILQIHTESNATKARQILHQSIAMFQWNTCFSYDISEYRKVSACMSTDFSGTLLILGISTRW